MNKIERALIERGKRLLMEYAAEELEKYRKKIDAMPQKTLLDIFNSGVLLDVNKLQTRGIEQIQKRLNLQDKNRKF